jgi:hypothetical protein
MATVAVFIALGGGAYAAFHLPRNSVKSKHIVDGQVKSKDVRDDNLTGTDILESSLGSVPQADSAGHASGADKVNGMTAARLDYSAGESASTALTDFGTLGLLTFDAYCNSNGGSTTLEVNVRSSRAGMDVMHTESFGNGTTTVYGADDRDLAANQESLLAFWQNTGAFAKFEQVVVSAHVPGLLIPSQDETATLMLQVSHGASGPDCIVNGTGIAG